ncbi:hypothetical protein [Cupriavidus sp. PET2-C1]
MAIRQKISRGGFEGRAAVPAGGQQGAFAANNLIVSVDVTDAWRRHLV